MKKLNKEQLIKLYQLYTQSPFMSFDSLSKFSDKEFGIVVSPARIRVIMIEMFPDMTKTKVANKNDLNNICSKSQIDSLFKLYTSTPFLSYRDMVVYLKKEHNIKTNEATIKNSMQLMFPDLKKHRANNLKNERDSGYFSKNGEKVSAKEKEDIALLLSEGKTMRELAQKFNVSRTTILNISKKSNIDTKIIKLNKIIARIGDIDLSMVEHLWSESNNTTYMLKKLKETHCRINIEDMKFILGEVLCVKKKCRFCGAPVEYKEKDICSDSKCIEKKNRRHLPLDTEAFLEDCKNGMSPKMLCEKYDKPNDFIYRLRKKYGYTAEGNPNLDKEFITNEVVRLSKEKKTLDEMALILNISKASVANYKGSAMKKGLLPKSKSFGKAKPRKTLNEDNIVKEIAKLSIDVKDVSEIAHSLGLSYKTVSKYKRIAVDKGLLPQADASYSQKHVAYTRIDKEVTIHTVAKLTKEKKTIADISKALNISTSSVSNYRKYAVERGVL